jgi:protein tyrosine kinase modulator
MNKILEARISEGMEEGQKGEKFTLIDPASFPEKPVSPPRGLILLAGFILSLGMGLGSVALTEHLDHSVRTSDELARLTGLQVLGFIGPIATAEDITRARRKQKLIWVIAGGALIIGLGLCHFWYMDLRVLTTRLLCLVNNYA